MKTKSFALLLTISTIFLSGCGCTNCDSQDPAIKQIKTIKKMSFESNKKNAYLRLAQRPDLSNAAQIQLVKAAFDTLEFDSSKEMVLLTLIENPSFSTDAETAIMDRLYRLSFGSTTNNILTAIDAVHTLRDMENSEPVITN